MCVCVCVSEYRTYEGQLPAEEVANRLEQLALKVGPCPSSTHTHRDVCLSAVCRAQQGEGILRKPVQTAGRQPSPPSLFGSTHVCVHVCVDVCASRLSCRQPRMCVASQRSTARRSRSGSSARRSAQRWRIGWRRAPISTSSHTWASTRVMNVPSPFPPSLSVCVCVPLTLSLSLCVCVCVLGGVQMRTPV